MDSRQSELIAVLDKLIDLLESDDQRHWVAELRESKRRLASSDHSGVEYLLASYGGMGSFNDLIIHQSSDDGEFSWKPGYERANEELDKLRNRAWELANEISRRQQFT